MGRDDEEGRGGDCVPQMPERAAQLLLRGEKTTLLALFHRATRTRLNFSFTGIDVFLRLCDFYSSVSCVNAIQKKQLQLHTFASSCFSDAAYLGRPIQYCLFLLFYYCLPGTANSLLSFAFFQSTCIPATSEMTSANIDHRRLRCIFGPFPVTEGMESESQIEKLPLGSEIHKYPPEMEVNILRRASHVEA